MHEYYFPDTFDVFNNDYMLIEVYSESLERYTPFTLKYSRCMIRDDYEERLVVCGRVMSEYCKFVRYDDRDDRQFSDVVTRCLRLDRCMITDE